MYIVYIARNSTMTLMMMIYYYKCASDLTVSSAGATTLRLSTFYVKTIYRYHCKSMRIYWGEWNFLISSKAIACPKRPILQQCIVASVTIEAGCSGNSQHRHEMAILLSNIKASFRAECKYAIHANEASRAKSTRRRKRATLFGRYPIAGFHRIRMKYTRSTSKKREAPRRDRSRKWS